MCALDASASSIASSRPDRNALPDSSRPAWHSLPVGAGLVLTALERFGVQLHRHRGGLAGQPVIPQPRRQDGEDLIGAGGISVGQVPGGPPDQPGPVRVDQPGGQGGAGAGQPGFQIKGLVHRVAGRVGGGDQFHAELGVGELPVPAAARHLPRRRVRQLGLAAAGELRDRGQLAARRRGPPAAGPPTSRRAPGCRSAGRDPRRPARSAPPARARAASRPRSGPGANTSPPSPSGPTIAASSARSTSAASPRLMVAAGPSISHSSGIRARPASRSAM